MSELLQAEQRHDMNEEDWLVVKSRFVIHSMLFTHKQKNLLPATVGSVACHSPDHKMLL